MSCLVPPPAPDGHNKIEAAFLVNDVLPHVNVHRGSFQFPTAVGHKTTATGRNAIDASVVSARNRSDHALVDSFIRSNLLGTVEMSARYTSQTSLMSGTHCV